MLSVLSVPLLYLISIYCAKCDALQELSRLSQGMSTTLSMNSSKNLTLEFKYHNNTELSEFLINFTKEYKNLTRLYSIGKSHKQRELWVVEVHNKFGISEVLGVPNVKIIGNMHGNEPAGREVILHLLEHLVTSYINGDEYIQWLVNNTRIHLLPSLNPDGFEVSEVGESGSSTGKTNSNNVHLNKNFPGRLYPNKTPMQLETKAIIDWLNNNTFVLSANLLSKALVAIFPYDSSENNDSSPTPDNDVFEYLASLYARNHPEMHQGKPCKNGIKFKNGLINGASLDSRTGSMQDYNYFKHGCMEITFLISCSRYPQAEELEQIWDDNRKALLVFISQAHRGIRGFVKGKNGKPISNAVLQIDGRNTTFNTTKDGEFWRVLLPHQYCLKVEADGYCNKGILIHVPEVSNETTPVFQTINITLDSAVKCSTSEPEKYCYTDFYETTILPKGVISRQHTSGIVLATTSLPNYKRTEDGFGNSHRTVGEDFKMSDDGLSNYLQDDQGVKSDGPPMAVMNESKINYCHHCLLSLVMLSWRFLW